MTENINRQFAREVLQSNPHTAKIVNDLIAALQQAMRYIPSDGDEDRDILELAENAIKAAQPTSSSKL